MKADYSTIKRLLTYFRPHRSLLILCTVLLIIAKGLEAYIPLRIGALAGVILDPEGATFDRVLYLAGMIFILLVLSYIADALTTVLKAWVGQKAIEALRLDVFNHIQHLDLATIQSFPVGNLMTRTIHDIDQISQVFTNSIVPIFGSSILFVAILVGIFFVDPLLAMILIATIPLALMLARTFQKRQKRAYGLVRKAIAQLNTFVQENLMGASTVRSFNLKAKEKHFFDVANEEHRKANVETVHNYAFFIAGLELIQNLIYIILFVSLVLLATNGFQAAVYFTFSLYVLMLFRPIADLADRFNEVQAAVVASGRVFGILDMEGEIRSPQDPATIKPFETLEFENVSFAYENGQEVLKNISFQVNVGESLAIVGLTGSGKTTLIHLLLRFYDPQQGRILLNGKDLRAYNIHALRKVFSLVLQDPVIFSGSLKDNITLDNPDVSPEVTLQKLFPHALSMPLSEHGANLSAGEMQVVSLLRAAAHPGKVFVLDEATAHIDMRLESQIQDALEKVFEFKTSIVIAHRLFTIRHVQKIIVIHAGELRETGTHESLMAQSGLYKRLYHLQFSPHGESS